MQSNNLSQRTVSGLSVGCTRVPSNKNLTELGCCPDRSQKASINFLSWVVFLILKKISELLSVTLMLRCSGAGGGASPPPGEREPASDMSADLCGCKWVLGFVEWNDGDEKVLVTCSQNACFGEAV